MGGGYRVCVGGGGGIGYVWGYEVWGPLLFCIDLVIILF